MIYHNYIYIYRRTIFKNPIFLVYLETRSPSTPLLHRLAQYNVHSQYLKCIAFVQNGSMNIEKLDRQKWGSKWGLLLRFVECFRDLYSLVQNLSRTDAQSWCHLRLMPRMSQAFLIFFATKTTSFRCFLYRKWSQLLISFSGDSRRKLPEARRVISRKEVEVCHHWNHGQCNKITQLTQAEAVKDVEGRWKAKRETR